VAVRALFEWLKQASIVKVQAVDKLRSPNLWRVRATATAAVALLASAWSIVAQETKDSPTGQLAVGQNADGRLEVFQIDVEGALRHRW
jgi:hypothetical protein